MQAVIGAIIKTRKRSRPTQFARIQLLDKDGGYSQDEDASSC